MSEEQMNHDQITKLCGEVEHMWREMAELRETVEKQTSEIKSEIRIQTEEFKRERKDHSQRIRFLESQQAVLYQRWKLFATIAGIVGVVATIIGVWPK